MEKNLKGLTKPLRLGSINVKNRIWNSPLWTRTASADGEVTDRTIAHYLARAKGGAGVITTEGVAVDGRHTWNEPQMRIDEDRFSSGHRRLVEQIHMYGTPIICQLHHAGMFGTDPVSPSGVPCQDMGKIGQFIEPRILSTQEVEEIRNLFIDAAVRAMLIGYDGVEVHGATAYLLEQFFSPHNNKRNDKYGGSLQGRSQLSIEVIRGIRQACGPKFIIGYTAADCDMIPGGIDHEQTLYLAMALEKEGLTYFDLQTDGTYETFHLVTPAAGYRRQPKGQFEKTALYKKSMRIPVTTRGAGEYDPEVWNGAFEHDMADAVRLGKQMLADPDVANKSINGAIEDIRPCIKCGNCLLSGEIMPRQLSCSVNSGLGNMELPVEEANKKKKVLVIGGGPAGLEAARVCALRGHDVKVLEKSNQLGGNMVVAALPIGKETFDPFIPWAERQCRKLDVEILLNTTATPEIVLNENPDTVIIAAGSDPLVLPIKGIDQSFVYTAEEVLTNKAKIGKKIVIAGGGEVGLETADFIMENNDVDSLILVEMLKDIGPDMNPMDKAILFGNDSIFPKHFRNGFQIKTETKIRQISKNGVSVIDSNCRDYEIEADTVILAMGYSPNNSVYEELNGKINELYLVGDAMHPRKIVDAIHQSDFFAKDI